MIKLQDVSFCYGRRAPVFDGLSLEVPRGVTMLVLAPNSSGKTTLFDLIAGLRKPLEGSVRSMGYEPHKREVPFLSRLSYCRQELLRPAMSLYRYGSIVGPMYPSWSDERFRVAIADFNVEGSRTMTELSPGRVRAALLALSFGISPDLCILDEPTDSLDLTAQEICRSLVLDMSARGVTTLIASHQPDSLGDCYDWICILSRQGVVLHAGPVDELDRSFHLVEAASRDELDGALAVERTSFGWVGIRRGPADKRERIPVRQLYKPLVAPPQEAWMAVTRQASVPLFDVAVSVFGTMFFTTLLYALPVATELSLEAFFWPRHILSAVALTIVLLLARYPLSRRLL